MADNQEQAGPPKPRLGHLPRIPDDINLPNNDAVAEPTAEPDPVGYVRPESIGPVVAPDLGAGIGQYQTQGVPALREPQPLRPVAPEYTQNIVDTGPGDGFKPLERNALRCPSCGSTVGVFRRDPYTGSVIHQGCSPNRVYSYGQQGPARQTPQTGGEPHELQIKDAKADMKPPDVPQ